MTPLGRAGYRRVAGRSISAAPDRSAGPLRRWLTVAVRAGFLAGLAGGMMGAVAMNAYGFKLFPIAVLQRYRAEFCPSSPSCAKLLSQLTFLFYCLRCLTSDFPRHGALTTNS
ncbi:hypothetical protein XHV734_4453 [Xanthomonas hortorum pv. vitians]|nr:hypothetical protein XHV734_4453 [Xanthomonas hortorum pv. vitians]